MPWLYPQSGPAGNFDQSVDFLNIGLDNIFFVEVGAMDGVNHDSLYSHIIKHTNWKGLLVEPLPDMFKMLKATYAGRKNLLFENSAITDKHGKADITRIPIENVNRESPQWADGISTLKPEIHIISRYDDLKPYSVTESIKTVTFASLVKKYKIKKIDVLQIDTEGYDKEIFDQIWEAGFRPRIIKLEISYSTYIVIRDLQGFLEANDYNCFFEGENIVAVNL